MVQWNVPDNRQSCGNIEGIEIDSDDICIWRSWRPFSFSNQAELLENFLAAKPNSQRYFCFTHATFMSANQTFFWMHLLPKPF
jgi:hypothetical protein